MFVAGASKGVGRFVVNKLLSSGHKVVALVRSDEAFDELSALDDVTAIKGDAMEYKDVEGALDGCDAAISTLGGAPLGEGGKWGKNELPYNWICYFLLYVSSSLIIIFILRIMTDSGLRWKQ